MAEGKGKGLAPQKNPQTVQRMFDDIASVYDRMNRIMTFGRDQAWRRELVALAQLDDAAPVLDLATGTGDIAAMFFAAAPKTMVIGADFSGKMLRQAQGRFRDTGVQWQRSDAAHLPFADNSFQAVTFGYLLRNVVDVDGVLAEVHRVLRPGGRVVSLDTTPPGPGVVGGFSRWYLRHILPWLGQRIAGDASAYGYLKASTLAFDSAEQLAQRFTHAGFVDVNFARRMLGSIALHWGRKS